MNLELESLWLIELEQEMDLKKWFTSICRAMFLILKPSAMTPNEPMGFIILMIFGEKPKWCLWFSQSFDLYKYVLQSFNICMSRFLQEKLEFMYACHDF